jgi:catechol 2,3-dioxygenase-like lactoylglutathione lyase family enzyme
VKSATSFYKDILGFELLGKGDPSQASLYRAPPQLAGTASSKRTASAGRIVAPPNSIQLYLRIAPMDANGVRLSPPPATLWIQVNDVDEVFKEITTKWNRFQPKEDEYFPTHLFGDAKILSKPQNKAWGTRELHIIDGDDNKMIFFKNLY